MSQQQFTYLMGFNGFIPVYWTLEVPDTTSSITPLDLTVSKHLQQRIDFNRDLFQKVSRLLMIPKRKFSTNYKGNGTNFNR